MYIYEYYACFVMKCDLKCYDYVHLNGRLWRAVYNNVQALVALFWHTISVFIHEMSLQICVVE